MVKFSVFFYHPQADELAHFENTYNDFLALIERMPHVRRRQVNTVLGSPLGKTRFYRVLEAYFDDQEQMNASLRSAQGQEAGGELQKLPSGTFEIVFAEVYEEAGGSTPLTPPSDNQT
jgi:uncharacterized protein (TIGR02118 family)